MIRIKPMMNVNAIDSLQFYLNGNSVGLFGKNTSRADIQLVQVFLKNIFNHVYFREAFKTLPKTKGNAGFIIIDGVAGPQTNSAIAEFQKAIDIRPKQIGRVDVSINPVSEDDNQYKETILALNTYFYWLMGIKAILDFKLKNLPDVKQYAPQLLSELNKLE